MMRARVFVAGGQPHDLEICQGCYHVIMYYLHAASCSLVASMPRLINAVDRRYLADLCRELSWLDGDC
jgi:hypothetical protein